jgi:hypothetical protein
VPAISALLKFYLANRRIDWALLRRQKATLVKLIRSLGKTDANHLQGILSLVDSLQDFAVDKVGLSEKTVFGRRSNENHSR